MCVERLLNAVPRPTTQSPVLQTGVEGEEREGGWKGAEEGRVKREGGGGEKGRGGEREGGRRREGIEKGMGGGDRRGRGGGEGAGCRLCLLSWHPLAPRGDQAQGKP